MKLNIKNGTTYLDDAYLKQYPNLKKISLPKSLRTLPLGAFYKMQDLVKVYFPKDIKLTKIPESCFAYCESLTQIHIPSSVVTIEKHAFKDTTSFIDIEIPKTVDFVDPDAFSGWLDHQIIYVYKPYEMSQSCKAEVVLLHGETHEKEKVLKKALVKYFIVEAKCGHVGRHRYMPIKFPVQTSSKKEAGKLVKKFPRVKHDHKDAILSVTQVSKQTFEKQVLTNKEDPYLNIHRKQDQKKMMHLIEDRLKPETNYVRRKN